MVSVPKALHLSLVILALVEPANAQLIETLRAATITDTLNS